MLTCSMMRFLSLTAGSVCLCGVWGHLAGFGISEVVLVPYVDAVDAVTVMRVLLFVLHVCMLRECEGDSNAGVGMEEVWLW